MKLWYSDSSPYARKVRSVIHYHQLQNQIELLPATSGMDKHSPHNQDNPLGRLPALQMANNEWLYNSSLIAEYLDHLGSQPSLYGEGEQRWQILRLHYLADGILENEISVIPEKRLRPQSEWWIERHQQIFQRTEQSLIAIQQSIDLFGEELNIGTLNTVCAIDFLLFRKDWTYATKHPVIESLKSWAEKMNARYACLNKTYPK
ncbi:glutathione S-transferase N-terminal domain-containing protein [Rodentibacter pneumotropicus]|uniref:Glutathione S-transferase n=1 Tax=Rodentibacter pneumotropicus TaxID=758 RepID=A0A4S2P9K2_9PAST|nr:glutathione S-transferase N-terminal domain-containing protein [Rodentibacter pneumotropicus]TGZ99474.1 glutathione S-transferase [Rodentibacter pneumotropicus]TGZ99996.1 glutathione S-transferase [Rodentibacter pneumotropicus]THA09072.1 glutathione S-transferase [Rodentibacter pneumotropicus]THA16105.1 glutathione S-transferase [Rodentibacter pneumotropicus]